MEIRLEEMREIAKTLPIGYYLGRKVPVTVEPDGGAYCDVVKGEIHIGMDVLQTAASQIDAKDAAAWDREKMLRCLLYHEVGHLLLTPKWLKEYVKMRDEKGYVWPDSDALVNIFEDERLEQVLSRSFMGVDFKGFVNLVHKSGCTSTRAGKFLKAVRLRQTSQEISSAVDDAVEALKSMTSVTGAWDELDSGVNALDEYQTTLEGLASTILSAEEQKPEGGQPQQVQQQQSGDGSEDESEQEQSGGGESEENESEDEKPEGGGKSEEEGSEEQKPGCAGSEQTQTEEQPNENTEEKSKEEGSGGRVPRDLGMPEDYVKGVADKVFVTPTEDVANTLNRFAVRLSKRKGAQAAGRWSALHGRIDARRDALDKERIFRRRSDVGERINTSVNLVLWVDCSGSFSDSEGILNRILAATSKAMDMAGCKLTVSVVKMTKGVRIAKPNDWKIDACGGNEIDRSYADAWRKTRRKDRRNIDIIVFDGACDNAVWQVSVAERALKQKAEMEAKGYKVRVKGGVKKLKASATAAQGELDEKVKMLEVWNHTDCHVISDPSNAPLFDRFGRAHVTYVDGNYAEQLQAKVIETLDRIL